MELGIGAGALLRSRLGFAKGRNCAAIVIGVDKAGSLPVLGAARSGADQVANWLQAENYDVALLTDAKNKPVLVSDVFAAVNTRVTAGTLDQLVIYFAGHGFIGSYSEYWLLSGAPANPNEAISVLETIVLAKQWAIPDVIFISDCCRSRADSLQVNNVRGSLIFPTSGAPPVVVTDLDVFYATLVGDPSWEVPVATSSKQYKGIFTSALLDAFQSPSSSLVTNVDGQDVVTNATLKVYLSTEVPKRAQASSVTLMQRPDIQVASGPKSYIARVHGAPTAVAPAPAAPTLSRVASAAFDAAVGSGKGAGDQSLPPDLAHLAASSGFSSATSRIARSRGFPRSIDVQTGFAIYGAQVASVAVPSPMKARFTNLSSDRAVIVIDTVGRPAASTLVRFADGSGCVLATLDRFVGSLVVDDSGIISIIYDPVYMAKASPDGDTRVSQLDQLRAVVATAARFGVFRVDGGKGNHAAVARIADSIRVMKSVDATLGLYAAYAYANADVSEKVRSVDDYLRGDYQTQLFDASLLAGTLPKIPISPESPRVTPFCPMLSQGWSLLRVRNVRLDPNLYTAQAYLKPSLWTTFGPQGMDVLQSAFKNVFQNQVTS